MTKIYQLVIGGDEMRYLYHDETDAIEKATQIARDSLSLETMQVVEIWEAEEIEGVPVDELDWILSTIRIA